MIDDPIVAEVRRNREALLAKYDYDLEKMLKAIRESGIGEGHRVVSFPPRRPPGWKPDEAPSVNGTVS